MITQDAQPLLVSIDLKESGSQTLATVSNVLCTDWHKISTVRSTLGLRWRAPGGPKDWHGREEATGVRPEVVEMVAHLVRRIHREREHKLILENYQPPKGSKPQ